MLRTVTVIGLGLIGGSILRAAARAGYDCRGFDHDPATRAAARDAGTKTTSARHDAGAGGAGVGDRVGSVQEDGAAIQEDRAAVQEGHAVLRDDGVADREDGVPAPGDWRIDDSLGAAVDGADLIVLAVPPAALSAVLGALAGHPGIVTDVASVKQPALAAAGPHGVRFVAGHPMAGRELSGFAAGDASLFQDRPWVLCLDEPTAIADWLAVAGFARSLGALVVPAIAAEHDDAVARVSHLPHLAAAALAAQAAGPLPASLAAGSFADGTRVAASAPALWADICAANAPAVRAALDRLIADLTAARAALDPPASVPALETWFAAGHAVRAGWPPTAGRAISVPPEHDALLALGRAGGWLTGISATDLTAVLPT
jgi:prephenate dehydrogenase